jgi:phospholipase C
MRSLPLSLVCGLSIPFLAMAVWGQRANQPEPPAPATPIHHVVVIFPENISFDHYFGTYPHAKNPPNEPKFVAAPNTPMVNGLSSALLTRNANAANPENGRGAVRLTDSRSLKAATPT